MHSFDSVRTALELADEELVGLEAELAVERADAATTLVAAHQAFTAEIEAERARTTTERARAEAERARTGQVAADLDHLRAALVAGMARARVVEVPDTIAADGTADVGAKLTTWLSSVVGPATVRFPPFGTYRVDDASVVAYAPQGITYDFNGSTLLRTRIIDQRLRYPNRHGFLRLMKPVDVTVQRLRVDGRVTNDGSMIAACEQVIDGRPHLTDQRGTPRSLDTQAGLLPPHWPVAGEWGVYCQALAFEHGIDLTGAVRTTVEDCYLAGMGGDGIGTTLDTTHDLTIRRVVVRRNGRQGISLVAGSGFLLDAVDTMSARASIDIEPDTDRVPLTNVEIRNCRLASHLLPFASGGPGEIHNVNIHSNLITKGGVPILHVQSNNGGAHPRRNWRFTNNRVIPALDSAAPLIRLTNVHGATIAGNTIARRANSTPGRLTAVALDRCSGVTVVDNRFARADPVVAETNPTAGAQVERNAVV